jgi:anti-sigma factor RsiW
MNAHLTNEQFAAAVAGLETVLEAAEHLGCCVSCRHEVAVLQHSINDRREEMEAGFPNWAQQREQVLARLAAVPTGRRAPSRRWVRPLLAAAAVLVAVVGVGLLMPHGAVDPLPTQELAIEEILADVDAILADDSLPGFEPIDPGVDDPARYFENGTS